MAEHTKFHLWLNTSVATFALVVSAASGYFAWQTFKLKSESLGFVSNVSYECPLKFSKAGERGFVALCWLVTVTNQSDSRTSIVRFQAFDASNNGNVFVSGFPTIEDGSGKPINSPLSLDAGEARQYLMLVPISVSSSIVALAESLPATATLDQLQSLAFKSNLDIVGNKVDVKYFDEEKRHPIVSWIYGMRVAVAAIRFVTGRGNIFIAQMSYPSVFHMN